MGQPATDNAATASDEALAWVARLRADDVSDDDINAFALWLGSEQHRIQDMDAALDLWDDLGSLRHLPLDASSEQSRDKPAANNASWWALTAVAASVCLAILLWPLVKAGDPASQLYQTALGERRTVILADDSRLTLNTHSRVRVTYYSDQRHLDLLRGEAFFEVASDADRPFHVDTGQARVTAIGTAFNIRRAARQSEITVTEGVVRITETSNPRNRAPAEEILRANESLLASPAGFSSAAVPDVSDRLAWQRGELIAQEMRLPVLASELERYYDIDILIADADVAAMTVSGVFLLDQPAPDLLRALELTLDLEARRLDDDTVQLLKRAQ